MCQCVCDLQQHCPRHQLRAVRFRTGTLTLAGSLSDGGNGYSLTITGGYTAVLAGSNTFTGLTIINGGAIQVGNGGASGSLAGRISNNAVLLLGRGDNYNFSNAISGELDGGGGQRRYGHAQRSADTLHR